MLWPECLNGISPSYMSDFFTYARDINERPTRNADIGNLYVPMVFKQTFKQAIQYTGSKLWNTLPLDVRNSSTLTQFKNSLRKHILGCHVPS